jgi:spore coat polysaccharide biosynthesis protein SpsF
LKVGVVIQARMGSKRLPGKVLLPINGTPLLGHVIGRLKELNISTQIVVATSDHNRDDAIEIYANQQGLPVYRGSEDDVLDRYYQCAKEFHFKHIVRITADNPFVDIEELDNLIKFHLSENFDYTQSFETLPVGVGAEIFSFEALEKSNLFGTTQMHREHVNEFILQNKNLFAIGVLTVSYAKNYPSIRLTVDTPADYKTAVEVAKTATGTWVKTLEAIKLLTQSA